jgi:diguanylate cyclase (GGDEF)-like protein
VIESSEISRQHAILLRIAVPDSDDYVFRLVDGNLKGQQSTNGVFVNGSKKTSHVLRHGDEISFGGHIRANYHCVIRATDTSTDSEDTEEQLLSPYDTVMFEQPMTITETDAEMARLVSFLELSPHPIIELDLKGHITYSNPASALKFPDLKRMGTAHPILTGLVDLVRSKEESSFVREIDLGDRIHQQAVYYLPESQLIRLNMLDITQKKHAESELSKRDNLLQAIAQATNTLLVELNFETAVQKSIVIMGIAAKVDTIFVCQDMGDRPSESPINFQYEYSSNSGYALSAIPNFKEHVLHYYTTQRDDYTGQWHSTLNLGQAVHVNQSAVATEFFDRFSKKDSASALLVPLFLNERYWGFIGAIDWEDARQWSSHEESSFFTLATTIGAALNRKQTEEKMRHRALFDPLTELPNRSLFNEKLAFYLENAKRNGNSLVVMFLDLDRFKVINDTLGHTLGDRLLKEAAFRISSVLREEDMVARWGGDEFTILLPHVNHLTDATDLAARVLHTLEAAFEINEHELYVTGSIGITCLDHDKSDAESLIKHADIALYRAKEKGRNCYEIYQPSRDSKTPELLTLDKDMRRALIQEEFVVYYQPRVDITTNKIVSAEALVRWQHPEMGLISPKVFIPLAEENGMILAIGEWVLRKACLQTKQWQRDNINLGTVAVNLSPRQFRQDDLVSRVAAVLDETGLAAQYLELEITESEAIHDTAYTVQVLEEFHRMGVKVSVDDFGTGHSSLNRLQSLPFDNLKIDRSFVQDLIPGTKLSHIVSTIVSLGQQLGMCIVAEGVEETEQLKFLQSIHCDTVQGYLFYKPMSASKMQAILQDNAKPLSFETLLQK